MPSPFISVTTVALDELVSKYLETSKFGYFVSEQSKREMVNELVEFVETSRNLKSRGDKMLENTEKKR